MKSHGAKRAHPAATTDERWKEPSERQYISFEKGLRISRSARPSEGDKRGEERRVT